MLRRSLILALTAVASVGIVACGDDDDEGAAAPAPTPTKQAGPTTDTGQPVALQIVAEPNGELAWDRQTLEAPAGRVAITLTNESSTPHNVSIERDGEDVGATETITRSRTKKTFKLAPGKYTFYCSVANHREAGMKGTLTVR